MSDQPPDGRHATAGRPRKWNRAALIAVGALTVATAVSVGLLATGGHGKHTSLSSEVTAPEKTLVTPPPSSSPATSPATSTPAATPPASPGSQSPASSAAKSTASAPWSSANCPNQLASWRSTGADGQLQVVVTDLTIASQAATSLNADLASGTAPSAAVTALRSAATSLSSSTRAATKNLIPGCVSGAHQAEVTGLTDLGSAVADFGKAVNETGSGDYGTAQHSIRTAVTALQSGSAGMGQAITNLNRYGAK